MIIDFHTHMFPDKIAGRTLDYLSGIFGASPFADGTYTGLCNSMGKGAVDISIALPAVTKVSQVASINRFASAYTEGPVISFGGIHPECENYKEILKEIKILSCSMDFVELSCIRIIRICILTISAMNVLLMQHQNWD